MHPRARKDTRLNSRKFHSCNCPGRELEDDGAHDIVPVSTKRHITAMYSRCLLLHLHDLIGDNVQSGIDPHRERLHNPSTKTRTVCSFWDSSPYDTCCVGRSMDIGWSITIFTYQDLQSLSIQPPHPCDVRHTVCNSCYMPLRQERGKTPASGCHTRRPPAQLHAWSECNRQHPKMPPTSSWPTRSWREKWIIRESDI